MTTKLNIKFINCYGIKSFEHTFDFDAKNIFSVYAPNGTMKTSFAKTFRDFSKNNETKDLIFSDRITLREITDENNNELTSEEVFVVEPYIESYKSDKISTLLVNKNLKEKYEDILKLIEQEKSILFSKLKQLSGITSRGNPIEQEITKTFGNKPFFETLIDLEATINESEEHSYSNIIYNKIFDEKVLSFLNTKDFRKQIKEYIERYNTLIENSLYLNKGFNHSNASIIQKNLKENGFFKAKHSVNLFNGISNSLISNEDELQDIISKEMEKVLSDVEITKKFNEIDSKLTTAQLREFRDYLFDNKNVLPELTDLDKLKKNIWISYFIEQKELFKNLLKAYKEGRTEIERIIQKAREEETDWKEVITIFNKRFSVPFILEMKNQDDVILKSESPNLNFVFKDYGCDERVNVDESILLKVLSQGEKRALYILNIIFEVRARQKANQKTIFIVDDIADSFDYKNKYAIIEYLKEISKNDIFNQIVLTHNFDFHRTISGRLNLDSNNRLSTIKTKDGVKIQKETYQNNPFVFWKKNLHKNNSMLIASIPFVRNLAEFSGHKAEFILLTSLLHYKENTNSLSIENLEDIIKTILVDKRDLVLHDKTKIIIDLIFEQAENILLSSDEVIELENKIVLAIAIRLKAERFMIDKINDEDFWKGIKKNQTLVLIERYKNDFEVETSNIEILEQVNLMTPENIHINSFMYEPILDMANDHLKQLYIETKTNLN